MTPHHFISPMTEEVEDSSADTSPISVSSAGKKPIDTAFKQQRLSNTRPILTPVCVFFFFFAIGIPCLILGSMALADSANVVQIDYQYDGAGADTSDCKITAAGEGRTCEITLQAEEDMKAPVYLYYQLSSYYQNHRKYTTSSDLSQLMGCVHSGSDGCYMYSRKQLHKNCDPLLYRRVQNGTQVTTLTLSPCGLIANSIFNDVILVQSGQQTRYDGTAWNFDENKYAQPKGFRFVVVGDPTIIRTSCLAGASEGTYRTCSNEVCDAAFQSTAHRGCKAYTCPDDATLAQYYGCEEGTTYAFWYPDDEITQYFYESFPEVTTPMAGIMNDRFFVWMRTAVQPKFRKLYAVIGDDIRKGDEVKLSVGANFDVSNFHGTKSLVLTTTTWFGGKNSFLGNGFIVVGAAYLVFGVAFAVKHQNSPRALGDTRFLETPTLKSKTA